VVHDDRPALLLGSQAPVVDRYAPELLYPIRRAEGREELGLGDDTRPFFGCDVWHLYELSWLKDDGSPLARVGRLTVPADSPCMVESKSLKLYLNSLNNMSFASEEELRTTVCRDLAGVVGADVKLSLYLPDDASLAGRPLPGTCLDGLAVAAPPAAPTADMLRTTAGDTVEEALYTHLFRSLCPVTRQPDWASLWLHYRGPAIDHRALLTYLLAYRNHREFHEQCIERIFIDVQRRFEPELLEVQGFYTRRGGLDINPLRSTSADTHPLPRLDRQ